MKDRTFKRAAFKLYAGQCLDGNRAVWIDLHGNSYTPVASTPKQALHFAEQLRKAADWMEEQAASLCKP